MPVRRRRGVTARQPSGSHIRKEEFAMGVHRWPHQQQWQSPHGLRRWKSTSGHSAVLVIDMQNDFGSPGGMFERMGWICP